MSASLAPSVKTLVEVKAYLDGLLAVVGYEEASNGLVIGGRPTVSKIGLSVNCSFQAIAAAINRGCDLLVTHHAACSDTDAHLVDMKYGRIRETGLSLYAAHESMACARHFGSGDALARAVQLLVQGPFKPDGNREFGAHGVAAGRLAEFVIRLGNRLGVEPRVWKNSTSFGHVGVIPGWGGRPEWMHRAQEQGCDTILTGEALLFGILFAREAGLNLVLAGHRASETPGMMALASRVARDLKLDVTFIPEDLVEAVA